MKILTVISILVLLAGCRSQQELTDGEEQRELAPSIEGTWELRQMNEEVADVSMYRDRLPYLVISEDGSSFSGFGGCNQMGGNLALDRENAEVSFSNITATRMHCGDENPEPDFMQALQQVSQFSLDGTTLTLKSSEGHHLLFERTEG